MGVAASGELAQQQGEVEVVLSETFPQSRYRSASTMPFRYRSASTTPCPFNAQLSENKRFLHAPFLPFGDLRGPINRGVSSMPDTVTITQECLARAKAVLAAHGDLRVVMAAAAVVDATDDGRWWARDVDVRIVDAAARELGLCC